MKGQTVIDQLKIRASYGQTGKVNFPPYVARTTYKMFTDGWYKNRFRRYPLCFGEYKPNLGNDEYLGCRC